MEYFFDTESTGFPRSCGWLDPEQPHVVQFGYILGTEDNIVAEGCITVKPDVGSWEMNPGAQKCHGLSKSHIMDKGVSSRAVVEFIQTLLKYSHRKIAHNVAFDQKMLSIMFARAGQDFSAWYEDTYCTQSETKALCGLTTVRGAAKMPKLEELHEFLFGVGVLGTHNALADAHIMRRCYYELKKRGLV